VFVSFWTSLRSEPRPSGSGPREDCSTAPRLQRFYAHDIHPRNVPVAYIAVYFESCNWSTMHDGCRPVRASQQSL